MSGILSKLSASSPWLDQPASKIHGVFKPLFGADGPAGVKDFLYGTWLGHPVHPMMTDVSLSGWTMSMAFDLLGEENASDIALKIGTLTAFGTAVTGVAQWYDTQNLEEPKRIGVLHALLNTTALGFYAASIVLREQDKRTAGITTAWTGHAFSMTSAWIGGHLSYVLGIGVSRDAFTQAAADWTDAIEESALTEGEMTRRDVDGAPIMFLKQGDRIYATSASCTHLSGPLDEGERSGTCVKCPWHGSEFDLVTGKVNHGPATDSIDIYETRISDGQVQIRALPA